MTSIRATTGFLRILAILQMLTAGIAIVPLEWIDWWHRWLGLGAMPHDAVLRYTLRGGAFVQGLIGVLLWVMAKDVVRYRPLVVTTAAIYVASAPAFYFIDTLAHMPRFWSILDSVTCLVVGGVLLAFCISVPSETSA